jgi:hypothetical protein
VDPSPSSVAPSFTATGFVLASALSRRSVPPSIEVAP